MEKSDFEKGPNDLFGVFHEEPGVFVGDPYVADPYKLSRHTGKGFLVPAQPSGSGPDAMIDKTTKLTIPGDTYVEPLAIYKEPKVQTIHGKAFVPVGGTKKPSGAGSLYGIFGPGNQLLDTDASVATRREQDPADKKRNIYVTPAKKGGYGTPWQDRSIGGTRFDFVPDEYCRGRILEKGMKAEARAKIPKAFVSTGRTGKGIVPMPYTSSEGPDRKAGGSSSPDKDASSAGGTKRAWKGTSPPQKGRGYGCISSIPYVPTPDSPTQRKDQAAGTKPFKHAGAGHGRLSVWAANPYAYAARPPPDNDFSLLG